MISFIIVLLFIVSLYVTFKYNVGIDSKITNKGYGNSQESISILLDRVQWSTHYKGRLDIYSRFMIYSVIISFFVSIINERINSLFLLQTIIIVWLILISTDSYFTYHSDKYSSYFIDKNLSHIRKKLKIFPNLGKLRVNDIKKKERNKCFHFSYNLNI